MTVLPCAHSHSHSHFLSLHWLVSLSVSLAVIKNATRSHSVQLPSLYLNLHHSAPLIFSPSPLLSSPPRSQHPRSRAARERLPAGPRGRGASAGRLATAGGGPGQPGEEPAAAAAAAAHQRPAGAAAGRRREHAAPRPDLHPGRAARRRAPVQPLLRQAPVSGAGASPDCSVSFLHHLMSRWLSVSLCI